MRGVGAPPCLCRSPLYFEKVVYYSTLLYFSIQEYLRGWEGEESAKVMHNNSDGRKNLRMP